MKGKHLSIPERMSRLNFVEFGCLLLLFYLISVRLVYVFSYDTDLEGVEFALLHFVQMIVLKGHLYGNAAKFPYLLVVHAPLYYYVMAGIMKLGAVDVIKEVHTMYIIGRTVSLLLLLVNFYGLLKIVRLLATHFRYKIYLLLLFLLFLPSHFYAFRPDSFKVTFFILFVLNILRFYKTNRMVYNLLAVLFLALGILSKQDVLIYGLSFYAILFISERKSVYLISPVLLTCGILGIVYLYYIISGINLFKELFIYNLQYDSDIIINLKLIAAHSAKILPLCLFTYFNLRSKDKLTFSLALLSTGFILISTLFMLRTGSNFNYTYESVILLLLNAVLYLSDKQIRLHPVLAGIYLVVLLLFNQIIFYKLYLVPKQELDYAQEFTRNQHSSLKIKAVTGNEVLFIPDMKYYIFYPESNMIYGADWHYDRYCEIGLNIKITPVFIQHTITEEYDRQFSNGVVRYILVDRTEKSRKHVAKYYPHFAFHRQIDNFVLYQYQPTSSH